VGVCVLECDGLTASLGNALDGIDQAKPIDADGHDERRDDSSPRIRNFLIHWALAA
jgi:hypothetical protein